MFWLVLFGALAFALFLLRVEGANLSYRAWEIKLFEEQRRAEVRKEAGRRCVLQG